MSAEKPSNATIFCLMFVLSIHNDLTLKNVNSAGRNSEESNFTAFRFYDQHI